MGKKRIITDEKLNTYRLDNSEHGRLHFAFEKEDAVMKAVSDGDREGACLAICEMLGLSGDDPGFSLQMMNDLPKKQGGVMAQSESKQAEYAAVLTISFLARAAIRGGVDPYLAYDLNDLYLQQVSETESPARYPQLTLDAIDRFVDEVQDARRSNGHSAHVLRARQYIDKHLNQPLTLKTVSGVIGLSPTYFSAIFSQSEGIGFKDYVVRRRVEAAKGLLRNSNTEVGMISSYVGFSSQSHFGKIFKEIVGVSPLAYRNRKLPPVLSNK